VQGYLDQVADQLRARGFPVTARASIGVGPAATILRVLHEEPFDLVALTTHGASGFRRLMLGSVADKVIRASAKPVLVYRPPVDTVPQGT
jgi:nucleotide-binding universal stress UspA family protein